MANSVDPDQTAPIGAFCSGSTLFASILNLSVMLDNHLQQTNSADIFRCIFSVNVQSKCKNYKFRLYLKLDTYCFVSEKHCFHHSVQPKNLNSNP